MAQTLEERIQKLEEKVSGLAAQQRASALGNRGWLQTFGFSREDDGFKEMVELGREYRRSLGDDTNGAHS